MEPVGLRHHCHLLVWETYKLLVTRRDASIRVALAGIAFTVMFDVENFVVPSTLTGISEMNYGIRFLAAIIGCSMISACQDVVTSPNEVAAGAPRLTLVRLCVVNFTVGCESPVSLAPGASAQIEAAAYDGATDVSRACSFTWKSNNASIRIAVNNPTSSAIVSANVNASPQSLTVTATCSGVSGAANITIL